MLDIIRDHVRALAAGAAVVRVSRRRLRHGNESLPI